jgi:hypothetical protein
MTAGRNTIQIMGESSSEVATVVTRNNAERSHAVLYYIKKMIYGQEVSGWSLFSD